jgi:hypothetical protein
MARRSDGLRKKLPPIHRDRDSDGDGRPNYTTICGADKSTFKGQAQATAQTNFGNFEWHRCRHELARDFCGSDDAPSTREVEAAARSMGQQIRVLNVSTDTEIETAFATLTESRANALAVVGNPLVLAPHRVA